MKGSLSEYYIPELQNNAYSMLTTAELNVP